MRSALRSRNTALVVAVVGLGLIVVWPLTELFRAGAEAGLDGVGAAVGGPAGAVPMINTLWLGAVVTPLAVAAGAAAALVTERSAVPGRRALRLGLLATLLVPPFVTAQSWGRAFGPAGLLEDLIGVAVPGTYGAPGVVTVLTVDAVPLAYLVVAAGLAARAEPDLERAARMAGATAWEALRTVTLPLLRPAFVAAAALVFVVTINAFGVPAILGLPGGFLTLTTRIYRDLSLSADPAVFTRVVVLACSLVLLAGAAIAAMDLLGGTRTVVRTGAPGGGAGPTASGRRRVWPALLLWIFIAVTTVLPLLALTLRALTRAVGMAPVPGNWTLANFREALSSHTLGALGNSLTLAVAAATAVVLLGGLVVAVRNSRIGRSLGTAVVLTFAVPGSTLAVAVLLAYGSWLRDTLLLILLAYLAKLWAVGHRILDGSVDTLPADLPRAARVSGAGALSTLRTIVVPLLRPALLAAWLLVFLTGLHELTMSSLLYGPGTETLAVAILNAEQLGDVTVTSAMAVLLTLMVVLGAVPLLLVRRRR